MIGPGLGLYFVGLVFSFVEIHRAYDDVQPPQPNYARVQQALWHDALHAQS